jgi:hypothetical protein
MPRDRIISPDNDKSHVRMDLENAPEIAAELGHMCVAWASLEWRIFAFYVAITGIPVALARATFYSHFNTRGRIELLKAVATMVLRENDQPIPELAELENQLSRMGKTANKRNKYIHNPWSAWDEMPTEVFQMDLARPGIFGAGRSVKKQDLTQLIASIQGQNEALFELYHRTLPLLPTLRRKLDRRRSLPLAFARTHIPPAIRRKARRPPRQSSRG